MRPARSTSLRSIFELGIRRRLVLEDGECVLAVFVIQQVVECYLCRLLDSEQSKEVAGVAIVWWKILRQGRLLQAREALDKDM